MSTYAYRWADGTVSICSAKNKDEAAWLFDEIGDVSRKLIIKLKSDILINIKPSIEKHWEIDDNFHLGESIDLELLKCCYPHYEKEYFLDKNEHEISRLPNISKKFRVKLEKALENDRKEAERRIKKAPETPLIVLAFPKGLPGQKN